MAYDISQGTVETHIRRGGQFCCSFVANLLQYLCAKNYKNIMQFDKVIAKIEGCLTVYIQSGVTDIFPKFKMAAAAILDLLGAMGPPMKAHSWCISPVKILS